MTKTPYLLILSTIILLLSCRNDKNKILENKFEYKWYSLDGNLTIKNDKTFEFNRFTCISQSISKGYWKILNDTLILNSYDPKDCYFKEDFIIFPPNTKKHYPRKTIKNCKPNIGYVKFKNEKFHIKDSILIYINSSIKDEDLNSRYNFKKKSYNN